MDYSNYNGADAGVFTAVMAVFMMFFWIFAVAWVISVIGMWKAFEKAGKPGWAALIPIYNVVVMIEIVGKPMIWILWLILPCVNWIFGVWLMNLVSKSFGKSEGFTVGMIFFPWIFWPILGFGNSTYLGPSAAEARAFNQPFNPNNPFNQPPSAPQA